MYTHTLAERKLNLFTSESNKLISTFDTYKTLKKMRNNKGHILSVWIGIYLYTLASAYLHKRMYLYSTQTIFESSLSRINCLNMISKQTTECFTNRTFFFFITQLRASTQYLYLIRSLRKNTSHRL